MFLILLAELLVLLEKLATHDLLLIF